MYLSKLKINELQISSHIINISLLPNNNSFHPYVIFNDIYFMIFFFLDIKIKK